MLINKYLDSLEKSNTKQFWLFFAILVPMTIFMMECFHPGSYVFAGDDIQLHTLRIQALMNALSDGRFPVYMDYEAVLGYGYPTKWFYPDIMLIPFALLGNITGIPIAYKVMLISYTLLSGIFMYFGVKRIYKSYYVACIAALLYTFSFYRMQDLFERSALGESISMTFVPLAFWGLYEIIKGDYKKWYIISIGFSCLIFSHVIASLLTFITVVIFLFVYYKPMLKEKQRIYYLLLAGVATVFTTAYFLFPLLEQMSANTYYYTAKPIFNIHDRTIHPFILYWGVTSISFYPNADKNLFLPGIGSLLFILVTLRIYIREKSQIMKGTDICVIIGIALLLACLPIFPWKVYPFKLLNVIQFPWRFFEIATYLFAIGAAYYSYRFVKTRRNRLIAATIILVGIMGTIYIESTNCLKKYNEQYHFTNEVSSDNLYCQGTLEYTPAKVPSYEYMEDRRDSVGTNYANTQVSKLTRNKGITCMEVKIEEKPESIEVPLFYYKGYSAKLNNKYRPISESKNGLVQISDIDESGEVCIEYTGTILQKISPIITIISILLMCVYIYRNRKNKSTHDSTRYTETA